MFCQVKQHLFAVWLISAIVKLWRSKILRYRIRPRVFMLLKIHLSCYTLMAESYAGNGREANVSDAKFVLTQHIARRRDRPQDNNGGCVGAFGLRSPTFIPMPNIVRIVVITINWLDRSVAADLQKKSVRGNALRHPWDILTWFSCYTEQTLQLFRDLIKLTIVHNRKCYID